MKDLLADGFQEAVQGSLLAERSVLDVSARLIEASNRVQRALFYAATNCGCVSIEVGRPSTHGTSAESLATKTAAASASMVSNRSTPSITGSLCESCRDTLEAEMGRQMYYLAVLCNATDASLYDILIKELRRLTTLGEFVI
mgnify:CR=1 FL=1